MVPRGACGHACGIPCARDFGHLIYRRAVCRRTYGNRKHYAETSHSSPHAPAHDSHTGTFCVRGERILFWLLARFVEGFAVDGFVAALLGSLIVSVVTHVGSRIISGNK